jgi:hypothetical protein
VVGNNAFFDLSSLISKFVPASQLILVCASATTDHNFSGFELQESVGNAILHCFSGNAFLDLCLCTAGRYLLEMPSLICPDWGVVGNHAFFDLLENGRNLFTDAGKTCYLTNGKSGFNYY